MLVVCVTNIDLGHMLLSFDTRGMNVLSDLEETILLKLFWLPSERLLWKPTDLDLHCLQRQGISGFSRTRVKNFRCAICWNHFSTSDIFQFVCRDEKMYLQVYIQ